MAKKKDTGTKDGLELARRGWSCEKSAAEAAKNPDTPYSQNSVENRVEKYPDSRKRGLKPFQPGQSGNPGGRPKKKPITEIYEELLTEGVTREDIKKSVRALIRQKSGQSVHALHEMADRVEGRARGDEHIEHGGLDNLAELIRQGRERAGMRNDQE
jgi:hypothetical protein